LPRDLGQGAVVKEEGTERFVASVQGWGGMSEEVVAEGVVHGATAEIVMGFFGKSLTKGNSIAGEVGKTRPGQAGRKCPNLRRKGQGERFVDRSGPRELRREGSGDIKEYLSDIRQGEARESPEKTHETFWKCHRFFFRGFRRLWNASRRFSGSGI
jgi:hypothetical protein